MNEPLIVVIVEDNFSNTFEREFKIHCNRIDAIRWTISSEDLPYYIFGKIAKITVREII